MRLILKRDPEPGNRGDFYFVEEEDDSGARVYAGRIFNEFPDLKQHKPWFWGLDFFQTRGVRPFYGQEETLELAMEMFKRTWNSRPPLPK